MDLISSRKESRRRIHALLKLPIVPSPNMETEARAVMILLGSRNYIKSLYLYSYVLQERNLILEKVKKSKTFFSVKFRNHEENACIKSQETKNVLRIFYISQYFTLWKIWPSRQFQSKPKYKNKAHRITMIIIIILATIISGVLQTYLQTSPPYPQYPHTLFQAYSYTVI